jgi:membrane protein implicated in regulation of membrane protease activity
MNTNTIAALAGALGLIVAAVIAIGDAFQLPGWFQVVAVLLSVFLLSYTHVRWLRKQR